MKPTEFPEQTAVLAEEQPEYEPLPCYQGQGPQGFEVVSCWKFRWKERLRVLFGAPLWLRQLTFGKAMQPQLPSIEYPF